MRLLLDTCAVLWLLGNDPKLSGTARAALLDPANERWLSPEGWPRRMFSTLMSSSRSGQWIPSPPPMSRQRARCFVVPCRSRGYHASGASTVRPSANSTLSVSFVTLTFSAATWRNSFVKVLIPTIQQLLLTLLDQLLQPVQLMAAKTTTLRQPCRIKPEFGPCASRVLHEREPVHSDSPA